MKDLGIIKGKWKHGKTTKTIYSSTTRKAGNIVCEAPAYFEESMKRWDAHATLIADAGNTAQKCGLLPSELLRQRDELKEELAEQKRLYFKLFDEEISCMYCEAKIRRGSAIILCKECAENTEV